MEWKIYLRYKNQSYRILKLRQGANLDITIIPKNAVFFSSEIIENLHFDEQIQLKYESLGGKIDHYSAHSLSGQRHVKLDQSSFAHEPTIGLNFKEVTKPIPLLTIVATANPGSQEEPKSGKWFGFQLPDDVNYVIMELTAIPKDSLLKIEQNFTIHNEKKTREIFDIKTIEMRNCFVSLIIRATNHELTNISNNVIFQQVEGKSVNIIRVEKGSVLAQVSYLQTQ